ncbi:MAG: hypothetical protein RLZZ200_418, partial [Pseudomonadota bacterium]
MVNADLENLPGRGIHPLASLRAHRRIAKIVFLVVLLAGLPFVFLKGKPTYSTTSVM